MTCLVAYDIRDSKIRGKLARFLEKRGLRLQYSVFAVELERHLFRRFTAQLREIVGDEGKVAVIRLCIGCRKNALQLNAEQEDFYIF